MRANQLAETRGAGLRFLTAPTTSPLLADLRRRILERFPNAKFVSYASLADDGAVDGTSWRSASRWCRATSWRTPTSILSLDADFLGEGTEQIRSVARVRGAAANPSRQMNRLYVVEPALTVTGAHGRSPPAHAAAAMSRLRWPRRLGAGRAAASPALAPLAPLSHGQRPWDRSAWSPSPTISSGAAAATWSSRGAASRRAVHALAAALNSRARQRRQHRRATARRSTTDATAGRHAARRARRGHRRGRASTRWSSRRRTPSTAAPVDFKLAQLLERVPNSIYHALYEDETAAACKTSSPPPTRSSRGATLRATDGTVSIVQPLIAPLWGGIQEADVLAAFIGEGDVGAHALLKKFWQAQGKAARRLRAATGSDGWRTASFPARPRRSRPASAVDGAALAQAVGPAMGDGEAGDGDRVRRPIRRCYDGRFANNAWLQELPHPITKLTWDNAAMISERRPRRWASRPATSSRCTYRDRHVEAPIMHRARATPTTRSRLPLGYGRTGAEQASPTASASTPARCARSDALWFDRGVTLAKTGRKHRVRDHAGPLDDGARRPRRRRRPPSRPRSPRC